MPQKITIRSTENILKIVENQPEIKDLEKNEVSFFRGVILGEDDLKKSIHEEKRQLDAIVTNTKVDSYGDTINPRGIDWGRYDKNPVLLWQHNPDLGVIGTCVKHYQDDQDNTIATFEFLEGVKLADEAWIRYKKHVQRAFSIGFRVKKWGTAVTENDPDGYVFDAIEIFEISAVSLPAVEDALTMKTFNKLYDELDLGVDAGTTLKADDLKKGSNPQTAVGHDHTSTLEDFQKANELSKELTLEKKIDNIEKMLHTLINKSISGEKIAIEDKQPDAIDTIKLVESIRDEAKTADKSLGKILKNMKVLIKD